MQEINDNAPISNTESKSSNIIVFDLETQKGFHETSNISEMRVAAAVSCNCSTGEYKHYLEENVSDLINELLSAHTIIGYNMITFDYAVLKGYSDADFSQANSVDMMRIVQKELGFRPKLDNLLHATLGSVKTADGLQSLRWFKQGRIDLIQEYCYHDVRLTKELYEFGRDNGYVMASDKGKRVKVPIKW